MQTAFGIILFLVTLFFVIVQPRKLSIGWSACIGAAIALLIGVVTWHDVLEVTGDCLECNTIIYWHYFNFTHLR